MSAAKKPDPADAHNLFPEPKESFYLRIPQYVLDLCGGDFHEAVLMSKLMYWANFEYKDRLRRGKKAQEDEVPIQRSTAQLVGDCLGIMSTKTARKKLLSLESRGLVRSERATLARSNHEQAVIRFLNIPLLQKLAADWANPDAGVRRTRFVRGMLEVKGADGTWASWVTVSGSSQGDVGTFTQVPGNIYPGDVGTFTQVPGNIYPGLIKEEVKETPKGGKDPQRGTPGGTPNDSALTGGSGEDDRWVVEGVDFGPGSARFHGSNLDQCSPEDFAQILKLFRLAQEFGYGIQIPAAGKRPTETFFTAAMILRDYEQRTWVPEFTPAFETAWGRPETVGPPRGWEAVEADLRDAFQHDLAQKAAGSRNPGPFVRFLESDVADVGTSSQFWASLVQVRRSQRGPGPSAVLREQVSPEAMISLTRRFRDAPDRPRDPKVYWERCVGLQTFLKDHRPGIRVHAALVGGWFRNHPIDVVEVLDLYDMFLIETGAREPGDAGTGWPPVPGERDWDAFLAWGKGREPADSFDLAHRPSQSEEEAEAQRKSAEVERCFTRWRDDPGFYVDEDAALDIVRRTAPHLKSMTPAMLVHAVRLIQARKACTRAPGGLNLRALVAEATRTPSPKIQPQEEAVWALLGVEFLDSVRSYWEEHFPDKLRIPEAALFPNCGA